MIDAFYRVFFFFLRANGLRQSESLRFERKSSFSFVIVISSNRNYSNLSLLNFFPRA